jgi:hypothetical protein
VFAILATLRFRVRPKRAAQWIHKQSTNLRNNTPTVHKHKEVVQQKLEKMNFVLKEEGTFLVGNPGRSTTTAFQRYQAVWWNPPTQESMSSAGGAVSKQKLVTMEEWVQTMLSNKDVMTLFVDVLKQCPYSAFYFETRPVTAGQFHTKTLEFVLVDAPELHKFATTRPDVTAFAEHFTNCNDSSNVACVFTNLGKDATLIAPKPSIQGDGSAMKSMGHLGEFCRNTDHEIVMATWRLALQTYLVQVKEQVTRPLWFSTSGMGIAWLHFRVDQRPKYYTYQPYRDETR